MGSGNNGNWTFMDILSLMSFVIGLQNLELNISQENLDQQTVELKKQVDADVAAALAEIHSHLEKHDKKWKLYLKEWKQNGNN